MLSRGGLGWWAYGRALKRILNCPLLNSRACLRILCQMRVHLCGRGRLHSPSLPQPERDASTHNQSSEGRILSGTNEIRLFDPLSSIHSIRSGYSSDGIIIFHTIGYGGSVEHKRAYEMYYFARVAKPASEGSFLKGRAYLLYYNTDTLLSLKAVRD